MNPNGKVPYLKVVQYSRKIINLNDFNCFLRVE